MLEGLVMFVSGQVSESHAPHRKTLGPTLKEFWIWGMYAPWRWRCGFYTRRLVILELESRLEWENPVEEYVSVSDWDPLGKWLARHHRQSVVRVTYSLKMDVVDLWLLLGLCVWVWRCLWWWWYVTPDLVLGDWRIPY